MSRQLFFGSLVLVVFVCAAVLIRTCSAMQLQGTLPPAEKGTAQQVTMHAKQATTEKLGGKDRYLASVSTDKPIYKTGEKVYVRGVLLNAANHKPLAEQANATIEIRGPKGDVVGRGNTQTQDSVWGFGWQVPEDQAGGEYTVQVTYPWNGHAPAERKFDIRAYRAPRLKSQITFLRDGYGPGEKVTATLDVKRAEGGVPEAAKVSVTAVVDGIQLSGGTAKVDEKGLCTVSLDLPRDIPRGEGTLALVIEDGGVVETASKTIPILMQTVDVKVFPEGGDLIAGFPNRVYLQAKQPNGKPADVSGKLISKKTNGDVTVFKTEHEGRGKFEFVPEANTEYFLAISEPAGIKTTYPLPHAKAAGAVVHSDQNIFEKNQPVTMQVGSTEKKCKVTLSKREVEVSACNVDFSKRKDVKPGTLLPVSFDVPSDVDGVLTVTVWGEGDIPLAERLIFRQPAHPLKISVTADKNAYVPGDTAKLTLKSTDENGKPVSAMVGLTVTDDSVLEMIEKREQAPQLPVMLFLEPEVKDLADAHVYLDGKNPKAPLATDLLLGTQGWRRFALMDLAKFIESNGDNARRAVALKIHAQVEVMDALAAAAPGGGGGGVRAFFKAAMPMAMPVPAAAAPNDAHMIPRPMAAAAPPIQEQAKARIEADKNDAGRLVANKREVAGGMAGFAAGKLMRQQMMGEPMANSELQGAIAAEKKAVRDRRIMADAIDGDEFSPAVNNLILVREFAHEVRPNRQATDRVDFTETLYWNTGVKTDAKTGEATISFGLNDSVSTFRVLADGFGGDGALGAANIGVESVQPFYAEAKLPLEVTAGDKILLPISLINATAKELSGADVQIDLKGDFKLPAIEKSGGALAAGQRLRWLQPINVGSGNGGKKLVLNAKAGQFADQVTRDLEVKPKGFPIETTFGGMLEPGKPVTHTITIPETVVPDSTTANTAVYPTPLANMTEALQRLIQDPYGCFEQTCSTSYPLTMAQQYFLSHTGVDPKLVETSRQKLDKGYKQLVGFWCPDKGYEWFGENPGHEALTAFGLMHFTDMSQVREVDQNMVTSTRAWLYKQRDGQGGFLRKRRALHTWIEDKDCSNAYILWAMLETGQSPADLKPEIESLKKAAAESQNTYVTALAANVMYLAGDKTEAKKLMDKLVTKQKADGSLDSIKSSIVGSGGEALQIEGTSLATLAWLRDPAYAGSVEKSLKFLADSCKAGRYGSTQSTVLALRAIVTYDKLRARPKAPGKVRVFVDGQSVGDWADFNPSTAGAIKLPDITELLTPGQHKLELRMEGGGAMPYSMAVKYNTVKPLSDDNCKLDINVALAQDKITEGAATQANVTVINKTKDVLPTPIAIVGLPGGLEPRHDQLKELVKKGTIDAYEVRGREVVLYWRTLGAESKTEIPLSLIAAIPGSYTGPASRAYLYYTDEHKKWVDGLQVDIAAK